MRGSAFAQIKVASTFRQPGVGPTSPMKTQADQYAFMVRQERALGECEAKRAGLVNLIDAAAPKRKWWQFRKPES